MAKWLAWVDRNLIDGTVNTLAQWQVGLASIAAWTDHYLVDGAANGTARTAGLLGKLTRRIQSGYVQWYVAVAVAGLLVLAVLLGS